MCLFLTGALPADAIDPASSWGKDLIQCLSPVVELLSSLASHETEIGIVLDRSSIGSSIRCQALDLLIMHSLTTRSLPHLVSSVEVLVSLAQSTTATLSLSKAFSLIDECAPPCAAAAVVFEKQAILDERTDSIRRQHPFFVIAADVEAVMLGGLVTTDNLSPLQVSTLAFCCWVRETKHDCVGLFDL